MKRPNYQISLNGQPLVIKHAWNAANRLIPKLAQDYANTHAVNLTLDGQSNIKTPSGFVSGTRVYVGAGGLRLRYEINKLERDI